MTGVCIGAVEHPSGAVGRSACATGGDRARRCGGGRGANGAAGQLRRVDAQRPYRPPDELTTAARLRAGLSGEEPAFPWPAHLEEDEDTDEINRWFFETNRDKPVADVLLESRETFERVERAIAALPEDDLFVPDRFLWMGNYPLGLGPACVPAKGGGHYHEDHESEIRAWLARG